MTYISVDLAHYEIFRAKVYKSGINEHIFCSDSAIPNSLAVGLTH